MPTHRRRPPIRWGILGAGGIAGKSPPTWPAPRATCWPRSAPATPTGPPDFAAQHGARRSYGSYAELVADPDVDVVYIATTHPGHREQALLAIEAGKAVLIEKPVCLNAADAREVFAAAAKAGVFAMEAMWMRTNPLIRKAQGLVAGRPSGSWPRCGPSWGWAGPTTPVTGSTTWPTAAARCWTWGSIRSPSAGSSAARRVGGVTGTLGATGSDATVAMQWSTGGRDAQLWCSAPLAAPYRGLVVGTEGWIRTEGRFYRPSALTVQTAGQE